MTTRVFALPTVFVALFAAVGSSTRNELPVAGPKTTADLLVGTWKRVDAGDPVAFWKEFTRDGTYIERTDSPQDGLRVDSCPYRLEGNTLLFTIPPPPPPATPHHQIRDYTTTIESVTEDTLVTITTVRTRWTPEVAQLLAEVRRELVASVLADGREEQHRTVWSRVKRP